MARSGQEVVPVQAARNGVDREQNAKEQHLGRQKQPDAERGGMALLGWCLNGVVTISVTRAVLPRMIIVRLSRDVRRPLKFLLRRGAMLSPIRDPSRPMGSRRLAGHRRASGGDREERQQVGRSKHNGASRRQHVIHLKLRRIDVVAPRHAEIAEDNCGKKVRLKPKKMRMAANARPGSGYMPASDLRPPEMQAAEDRPMTMPPTMM